MKKIIMLILCVFMVSACAKPNAHVNTMTESSKEIIKQAIINKPECKSVGDLCTKQFDEINKICNSEIKLERKDAWWDGFKLGVIATFVLLIGIGFILGRFFK